MTVSTEFPDYPLSSLPSLPTAWEDTSWHNDTCPSWCVGGGWYVYVDYEVVAHREVPECSRYTVYHIDDDVTAYHGDDWEEVLWVVASL